MIKKVYEVENIQDVIFSPMKKSSFQQNKKYNVFFLLAIEPESINNLEFATLYKKGKFMNMIISSYIIYDSYLLKISEKGNKFSILLFQVISDKPIQNLYLFIKEKDKKDKQLEYPYEAKIPIEKEAGNCFVFKDVIFDEYTGFNRILNYINYFFSEYLEYFFDKKNKINQLIQRDLIKAIKEQISYNFVEMSSSNILQFVKYCGIFSIEPILHLVKIAYLEKEISKEYYLTNDFINKNFSYKVSTSIYTILLKIFSFYDIDYLLEFISSQSDDCCKIFFDCIFLSPIKIPFSFFKKKLNIERITKLQKNLFRVSQRLDQIIFIINLSEGLENELVAIATNLNYILPITDKIKKDFKGLVLNNPDKNDDIEKIFRFYNQINSRMANRDYKLLKIENIFDRMVANYETKPLDEYCKLNYFIKGEAKFKPETLEQYYLKIHYKGFELIKNGKMKGKEIIDFIMIKDIYYYNDIYCSNKYRDPIIFNFIHITDDYDEYKENIQLIKKHSLYKLFDKSTSGQRIKFYCSFLNQIKKLKDFNSIFEIFPMNYLKKDFIGLMNEKMKEVLLTVLDEKEENYENCFNIINKWLKYNFNLKIKLDIITDALEGLNYAFTSKYYFYLLQNEEMESIIEEIKDNIIVFFIRQKEDDYMSEESLINVLLYSPSEGFSKKFLDRVDKKILKEEDFYTKKESKNFEFFKFFLKNCNEDIIKKLGDSKYILESKLVQLKIINNLNNKDVKYSLLDNLISEDNIFYDKLKIIDNDKCDKIYDELKKSLNICHQKIEQLEKIIDYYRQFYNKTKIEQIKLITEKIKEINNMNISSIIKEQNFFKNNSIFNLEEALIDSKNIKYRNSKFFMAFYEKYKDKNNLSEDEIFKQSIKKYRTTLIDIITLKERKLKFFKIFNINKILNVINTNQSNDLKGEIDLTVEEFKDLDKDDYIKNELLNDLIIYSKKDKASKLLKGIIKFIQSFSEIINIEITNYFEEIKNLYLKSENEDIDKDDIKEIINKLLEKGFDIDNETPFIKFIMSFNKDALILLKILKDSNLKIRNLNDIFENTESKIQISDIDNFFDVYLFFSKIMDNEIEIKNDKILIEIFEKKLNDDNDILIIIESYQNSYNEIKKVLLLNDENLLITNKLSKFNFIDIYKKDNIKDIFFDST